VSEFLLNLARRSAGAPAPNVAVPAPAARAPVEPGVAGSAEALGDAVAGEQDAGREGVHGATADREWREITRVERVPAPSRHTDPAHDDRSPAVGPAAAPATAAPATAEIRPSMPMTTDAVPGRESARDADEVEERVAQRTADRASHDTAAAERAMSATARLVAPAPAAERESRAEPRPATLAIPARDAPSPLTQAVRAAPTPPAPGDVVPGEHARGVVDAGDQPAPARALPAAPPASRAMASERAPTESHDIRAAAAPATAGMPAPPHGAHEARTIQVRIGTIEIRTAEAQPTAPAAPPAPAPAIGFADYARVRRYGGWSRR
jgi:ribonuclease E